MTRRPRAPRAPRPLAGATPQAADAGRLRRLLSRLRPQLLTRVALALAAVGLLPVVIASFGLVDINRGAMEEQVLRTHIVAAQTAASRVGSYLSTRAALARGVAENAALADPRSAAAQELLGRELRAFGDLGVLAIGVVNAAGGELVRAQLRDEEAKGRARLALALPAGAGRGGIAVVPRSEPPIFRFEAPLAQGGGSVRLACDGGLLADMLAPDEIGEQASLALARPDGLVIEGSARDLGLFPRRMVESAFSGHLRGAGHFAGRDGERVLGAYAPVPGSDWVVLSRQPSSIANAVAGRVRRQEALALGAALLLIAALSGLAYASLVRPIRQLVFAPGAKPTAGGGDEIDRLRETFAALRRGLSDRQALADVFLGRYQVVEFLAAGGMGTVFRGWDPKLRRAVALKTVHLGEDGQSEKRSRLISSLLFEAVAEARVNHPNVVGVYDVEDAPEAAFIAMEYVDGINLQRLLWQRGRLRSGEVMALGAGIARGLAAAHELEVVHNDVKPANVLLGRDGAIKVTDFGIAGLIAAVEAQPGAVFGTPGYVPPESLMGKGYGRHGDLFALGVVLYECLTGTRPFVGAGVAEVMLATLGRDVPPLERRAPDVPAGLAALVMRLLAREPAERPEAAAVATDLERWANALGVRWSLGPIDPPGPPAGPDADGGAGLQEGPRDGLQWMPSQAGIAFPSVH